MTEGSSLAPRQKSGELIARVWHTVLLIGIFLGVTLGGALFQRHAQSTSDVLQQHPNVAPLYLSVIAAEWFLVYGVWAGIRIRGVHLIDLIGGRWHSAKDVLVDIGLAVVAWTLWIGIQVGVSRLIPSNAKSVSTLFPQTFLEVAGLQLVCQRPFVKR